jgi:hypothetical protein
MFDLAKLRAAHDKLIADTQQLAWRSLEKAGPEAKRHVRDKPGFTHRSGDTLHATKHRVVRLKRGGKLIISNSDRKAKWLNDGTRPHVIRPRRAKALRFFWRKIDRVVYFRQVNHPGTRPYRFLYLAASHAGDRLGVMLRSGMRRIGRGF